MLIGPTGTGSDGSVPSGQSGVQWAWNTLAWDLRYNWPQRRIQSWWWQELFNQIPKSGG